MTPALALLFAVASADYAGSAACADCHREIFDAQSSSAHAHALSPSKPPQPGDWAFGAGAQATTFVSRLSPDFYREEPQSWYRRLNAYAATPGTKTSQGTRYRLFDPDAGILRCFACHSTGPLSLAADQAIQPHELGVRCEACHGPAADHAADPARVHPSNPGKLSSADLNVFCGNCHRMPSGPEETPDLRNAWNVRHQPLLLNASACFQRSGGQLSCLTCHSPHKPLEQKLSAYDSVCATCHRAPRHARAVAGHACAECHMPAVKPQPHLVFANHRIAVYAPADPLTPVRRP